MIHFYLDGNPTHDMVMQAFHEQCPEESMLRSDKDYAPCDVAVVFGVYKAAVQISYPRAHIAEMQKIDGNKLLVIDSGFVKRGDDRLSYYSVGFNDINGWAEYRNENSPRDRWESLGVELKPWRTGDHIVLCGQVPWDANVQATNLFHFLYSTADTLRKLTSRKVVYRPHPKAAFPSHLPFAETSTRPLMEDLQDAHCVVVYNSNCAVDAVIEGVPAFTLGPGSVAMPVSATDLLLLDMPRTPERVQWAANLAYTQWRPDEFGKAWEHLFA